MLLGKTTTSCSWQYVYVLQHTVFWQICSIYHNMLCQHTVSTLIKMIVVVTNNNYNNSKSN